MIWLYAGRVPEHNIPWGIVPQPIRFVNDFVRGHGAQYSAAAWAIDLRSNRVRKVAVALSEKTAVHLGGEAPCAIRRRALCGAQKPTYHGKTACIRTPHGMRPGGPSASNI